MKKTIFNCFNLIKKVFCLAPLPAVLLLALSVFHAALAAAQLLLLQKTIDSLVTFIQAASGTFSFVYPALFLACLLAGTVCNLAIKLIKSPLELQVEQRLTSDIMDKFSRIRYWYFENPEFYDLLQRMSDKPDKKVCTSYISAVETFGSLVELIGIVIVLGTYSPFIALVYLVVLVFISVMNFKGMNTMNTMFNNLSAEERHLEYYGDLLSDKNSLYELRAYRATEGVIQKYEEENKKVLRGRLKGTLGAQKFSFLANFGIVAGVVLLFAILMNSSFSGAFTIGVMVALLSSLQSVLSATETCSSNMSEFAQNSDIIFHIMKFDDLEENDVSSGGAADGEIEKIEKIEFKNVSFRYPGETRYVLKNVSFVADGASYVSIVGKNGAGKSTIVKLLCRFYDPTEGSIWINGRDISTMPQGDIHRYFAVLFQDYGKFKMSVAENVALSDLKRADDTQAIKDALDSAMARDDFPDIATNLGKLEPDGIDISGGQWQKLALARTFFSPKKYLVMDEPTASLDPNAEAGFYAQVKNLLKRGGGIVISHRLASAVNADLILVFEDGEIVQAGNHESLLQAGGLYKEMFESQAQFYKETK